MNGVQGYARKGEIAVSPIAALPLKTAFHELAHDMLGHRPKAMSNGGEALPRNLREGGCGCGCVDLL